MTNKPTNSNNLRNSIIVGSLLMFVVPFIFITNLYPFMRFGMFAEKPTPSKGIELFEVRYNQQNQAIDQKELAIPPHMLSYLIRGEYYKGKIESCAQHLYQLAGASQAINIYKVTIREKIKTEELIYTYPNE